MAEPTTDLEAAIAALDDGYLRVQLLLAVRRAGTDEPRRAGVWHALAALLAAEQQRRRQSDELTGGGREEDLLPPASVVAEVQQELRLDVEALEAETFGTDDRP
jgi:hypothetical protein